MASNETRTVTDTNTVSVLNSSIVIKSVFIILYSIIFVLGISGNSLVVFVVIRKKTMRTATNVFIANLAASDIMMCLLAVPFTPLSYFLNSWVFGEILCHLVPMSLCMCVCISTLTSTVIAVDRYVGIIHPLKPRMSISAYYGILVALWLFASLVSLPLGVFQTLVEDNNSYIVCMESWPNERLNKIFTLGNAFLQYFVPCTIICYCYSSISLALHKRTTSHIGTGYVNKHREQMEIIRKRRMNKMLIAVVTIFVVCWLPLNIVIFTTYYIPAFTELPIFSLIYFVAHLIAMSSTIYNPFVYACMNTNFREEFISVIPCLFETQTNTNFNDLGGNVNDQQEIPIEGCVLSNISDGKAF